MGEGAGWGRGRQTRSTYAQMAYWLTLTTDDADGPNAIYTSDRLTMTVACELINPVIHRVASPSEALWRVCEALRMNKILFPEV